MDLARDKQLSLIGLVLCVVLMASVFLLLPKINYQAQGVLLPGKDLPKLASSDTDQIIITNHFPTKYRSLGFISVERHMSTGSLSEVKNVLAKVRELAAPYGANVVVGELYQSTPTGAESGMASYLFRGQAIKAG